MQTQSDTCIRYNYIFKGLRLTAGRRQRNGRTRSLVVRMMCTVGPAWGNVGLSWRLCGPILRPTSADLEAYVWAHQIRNMGTARKHCKTQDILMVGGLSWGYVDPSWGYVGPSWGQCGPILGLRWPILGLCWPILGLCWGRLGPMLGHLGAMLGQLGAMLGDRVRCLCKNMLNGTGPKNTAMGDLSTRTPYREVGGRGGQRI